jgi:peptidoglycan hydrolase-like protein with peptidoglycan-binding domain
LLVFAATVGLAALVHGVTADENVRTVQEKLRDGGFYSGQIDGAFSSQLAAALTRYQIRNGLPITGQLDVDTSKALGAKPAVTTSPPESAQSSETWRQLRKSEPTKTNISETPPSAETTASPVRTVKEPESQPVASPPASAESVPQRSPTVGTNSAATNFSTDRLRDYVGAFVLAGLDPHVGAEADFFADRVHYYNDGVISRDKVRKDLQRYAARWPQRKFWLAGDLKIESQGDNRVRVTFPLRYDLRNGGKHSSGKIDKTLLLKPAGDDYQIVTVNERKAQ